MSGHRDAVVEAVRVYVDRRIAEADAWTRCRAGDTSVDYAACEADADAAWRRTLSAIADAFAAERAAALAEVDAAAERIIRRGAVGAWRSGDWRALELSAEYQEDEPAAGLREGLTWFIGATDADTATGAILAEAASLDRAEPAP